jgi:hypothetical protein
MDIRDKIKAWENHINNYKKNIMDNKDISKKIKMVINNFDFLKVYKYMKSSLYEDSQKDIYKRWGEDNHIEYIIDSAVELLEKCENENTDCTWYGIFIAIKSGSLLKLIYPIEYKESDNNFEKVSCGK